MFVLVYPICLIAFYFVTARFVVLVWIIFALINVPAQAFFMRKEDVQIGLAAGVFVGSLFLWPIQFAAAINSSQTEKEEHENRELNREKVGALPATIEGTVTYTHHHGTEEGHDSVWLDEYGDLGFLTDSKTYDRIGIAEGRVVALNLEEREAPADLEVGSVLWIVGGKLVES